MTNEVILFKKLVDKIVEKSDYAELMKHLEFISASKLPRAEQTEMTEYVNRLLEIGRRNVFTSQIQKVLLGEASVAEATKEMYLFASDASAQHASQLQTQLNIAVQQKLMAQQYNQQMQAVGYNNSGLSNTLTDTFGHTFITIDGSVYKQR